MDLKEYQTRAASTDQNPKITWPSNGPSLEPQKHELIPLLGLAGKTGELLSEYKKVLRDGKLHQEFTEEVAEELGDVLWYVANVATKFGLDLSKVAEENLAKAESRWIGQSQKIPLYDANNAPEEQLPRKFVYEFSSRVAEDGLTEVVLLDCTSGAGIATGDNITDGAYEDDGFRFHDVLHLAFMAYFGWSPVLRKLLNIRTPPLIARRTPALVQDTEDGGRAQLIEEGIVGAAYVYAEKHAFLENVEVIDWRFLQHIKEMTAKLEVRDRTTREWNDVLLSSFDILRKLRKHKGGRVVGDLIAGTLSYTPPQS